MFIIVRSYNPVFPFLTSNIYLHLNIPPCDLKLFFSIIKATCLHVTLIGEQSLACYNPPAVMLFMLLMIKNGNVFFFFVYTHTHAHTHKLLLFI